MEIIHREDRSASNYLLQNMFLKPFASMMTEVKPSKEPGSVRLKAPWTVRRKCKITERKVEDIWLYDIVPKSNHELQDPLIENVQTVESGSPDGSHHEDSDFDPSPPRPTINHTRKRKRFYFFAGGSWQMPPDDFHWKFLAMLVVRLEQPAIVTLISAPLAPMFPCEKAFPWLVRLYHALAADDAFAKEDVCFSGDSSGGNIALALVMHCISHQHATGPHHGPSSSQESDPTPPPPPSSSSSPPPASQEQSKNEDLLTEPPSTTSVPARPCPKSILLLCPSVDLTHTDPNIPEVAKLDPMETLEFVKQNADAWAGGLPLDDPRVSPVFGPIEALAKHNVKVYGILAGHDILSVAAKNFVRKCQENNVLGRFLVWEKQIHDFPLMAPYKVVPEANTGLKWIVHALNHAAIGGGVDVDGDGGRTRTRVEGEHEELKRIEAEFVRIEKSDNESFRYWRDEKLGLVRKVVTPGSSRDHSRDRGAVGGAKAGHRSSA